MGLIGDNSFYGNVVRENLFVRVENRAALCVNNLLVNVFFSSKTRILVVFYGL
jgi:hypothetical protein